MTHDPNAPDMYDTPDTANAVTIVERPAVMRRRLPNRRHCQITAFESGGMKYTACIGRFPDDGSVAEVFLNVSKSGSELEKHCRDASVLLSIGLQFGVPLEVYRRALSRKPNGAPDSALAFVLDELAKEVCP
jgi:ribonucleoside-diphosphate reductase alpha chain